MSVERWSDLLDLLPGGLTKGQAEAIRRAGAGRRHAQRVEAAALEIEELTRMARSDWPGHPLDDMGVRAMIARAICQACARAGSGAWESAYTEASMRWHLPTANEYADIGIGIWADDLSRPALFATASDGLVVIMRDDEDSNTTVATISSVEHPCLAEHLLAAECEERAAEVDRWAAYALSGGEPGVCPVLPDASACAELERLRSARFRGEPDFGLSA